MLRSRVFHPVGALAAVAALLAVVPARAEPTPIEVAANATWMHDDAKLRFPREIDGFQRDRIVDFGDQRFDVSAQYYERSSASSATVYLFRAAVPDVALWHDRALDSVRFNETLGTPDAAAAVTAVFTPPGSAVPAGLLTVMPVHGKDARSTAVALFRQGRWLIKVRMTSNELDPAQLGDRIARFLAALPLDPLGGARPIAAMTQCADEFRFAVAERAAAPNMAAALELAISSDLGEGAASVRDKSVNAEVAPPPYCRDAESKGSYTVYRHVGGEGGYVLAFGDAGVSASVQRHPSAVAAREGSADHYWVSYADADKTRFYRGFLDLPTPAQAIEAINGQPPFATVQRQASGDSNITLAQDQLREEAK